MSTLKNGTKIALPFIPELPSPFPLSIAFPKAPICAFFASPLHAESSQTGRHHSHDLCSIATQRPGQPPGFSGDGWGLTGKNEQTLHENCSVNSDYDFFIKP